MMLASSVTICDIIDIEPPSDIDGISFLPELRGEEQTPHEFLYWEFPSYGGQMAVRMGNLKALRKITHRRMKKISWESVAVPSVSQNFVFF